MLDIAFFFLTYCLLFLMSILNSHCCCCSIWDQFINLHCFLQFTAVLVSLWPLLELLDCVFPIQRYCFASEELEFSTQVVWTTFMEVVRCFFHLIFEAWQPCYGKKTLSSFLFQRRKPVIRVWNNMKLNKCDVSISGEPTL